ncbi:MAG: hypothetical protein HYW62_03860 [Candidatus Levybacteria bacterium]|nr:hypothetical protein [Candidatus Levybacteria bacterium]
MSKLRIIAPIHFFYDDPRDRLPDEIKLEDALSLRRKDDKLNDLIAIIVDSFQDIYAKYEIDELKNCRFYAVYEFDSSVEDSDKAQKKIHHIIESLRVVRPTRAASSTFLFSLDHNGNLSPEGASQKTNAIFLIYGEPLGSSHFQAGEEKKIQRYYYCVSELFAKYQGSYNRVLNAFNFFQLGYLTHYAKLRTVPFAITLESLFNTSESEVGYSLRMRCAAFLGQSITEKKSIIQKIKTIYELRSSAVHGASLPRRVLSNPLSANEIIRDAEDIARRSLQKIFDEDLVGIFSQPNEELNKYLDEFLIH